ncbi:hypothetical protein FKW77_000312 [Venturia effusa]|uniref:MYND-type domain-containing protein n=1 Tax=Venturia effusa TaxID=50376 RepID=A0A517L8F5_9PEZI|nr:hypothetical protein FKW77_000312 [Venturia effusa]
MANITLFQASVLEKPYSIEARLALARQYALLGYPDLSAGEAYMALLLIDEVRDECGEYHQEAFQVAQDHLRCHSPGAQLGERHVVAWVQGRVERETYDILVDKLILCGNLRSAAEFLLNRWPKRHRENDESKSRHEALESLLNQCLARHFANAPLDWKDLTIQDYPDRSLVRRELYAWNDHEPDRCSAESVKYLNDEMAKFAPKLEVKVTELQDLASAAHDGATTIKQLGVFAKQDLNPNEEILFETSLLTATSRLNESFCDACSKKLASLDPLSQKKNLLCPDCQEAIFCSQRCLHLAQESYHPVLCDADVSAVSKNQPAADGADALYSLLLLRALAMAAHQEVHPLDLSEVKYIWGDYHNVHISTRNEHASDGYLGFPRTLPFSFHFNVLLPIHMLEKMDVNIFTTSHLYAPWVTNTLYSKFRGTASARQGLDGRPEIPDHLQLHFHADSLAMVNNRKQKKQRAAAGTAMNSSSKDTQRAQLAASAAASSLSNDQQNSKEQPAVAASDSQDSIIGTIIKGLKSFSIDSSDSVVLKKDNKISPSDKIESFAPVIDTKASTGDNGEDNAMGPITNSEDDLDFEWAQVDINGQIKGMSDSSPEEHKDATIKVTSNSKGEAKPEIINSSLEQDCLDREWEHVEAENSQNDNTIFTLEADRHLCILWFFTAHSFSTMASLLNYSLAKSLPMRIHGQDAKDRFLELAKSSNYPRAFVFHEVKRLSEIKGVDWQPAVQQMDRAFTEAWGRMQEDISVERERGEKRERYDDLSDVDYVRRLGKSRLWSVEERKLLQGRPWGGLGAKVTRPKGEQLGSYLDIHMQGVREAVSMSLGKKKGFLGLGIFGL